jgi:DNA repair protein RadC
MSDVEAHRNDIGDRAGPCDVKRRRRSRAPRTDARRRDNYIVEFVTFRVVRDTPTPMPKHVDTPADAAELARAIIPDDGKEHFSILLLNTKNRVVAVHKVSVGSLSACPVHPREVFAPALRVIGVAAIILLHNHPSGDATPSSEDIRLTKQLVRAAELLDLRIHDHVVIANGRADYVSMHEAGLM